MTRLPPRDLVLLPFLSLMTVLVMLSVAELASRIFYTTRDSDACLVADARLGLRYKPNCTSVIKSFESPSVINRYNECGYRSDRPCGPAPSGAIRVAVLGSSLAMGYLVPENETFAVRAADELTQRCGRSVEFQPLGGYLIFWTRVINRVDDALRLKPDAVLLQVSTYDLERPDPGEGAATGSDADPKSDNILVKLQNLLVHSRSFTLAQHFLFQNEDLYLNLYLHSGGKSAYLREPLNEFWRHQLQEYDIMVGQIARRFQADGVPMALVFVPQRAQAGVAADPNQFAGLHPYLLTQQLEQIAAKHGVAFIDTTPTIAGAARIADLYYAVDGHLNGKGHTLIASEIVDGMIADLAPFRGCGPAR